MSWTRNQIIKLQIYRRAAGLADAEYREILHHVTGATSSTAPGLTNYHYDQTMARVETVLAYRVAEGFVPAPDPGKTGIRKMDHWRKRLPEAGEMSVRQRWMVFNLWKQLSPELPAEHRSVDYLKSVAAKACCRQVTDILELTTGQAWLLIEALKDRLHYAVRRG